MKKTTSSKLPKPKSIKTPTSTDHSVKVVAAPSTFPLMTCQEYTNQFIVHELTKRALYIKYGNQTKPLDEWQWIIANF